MGTRLRNPELAATLRAIARDGADAFYRGPIAADIVAAVRGHASNPGRLSESDLAGYRAKERAPVCSDYKTWRVCGMGPPSSGGIAIAQMLGIPRSKWPDFRSTSDHFAGIFGEIDFIPIKQMNMT
jgi:gamma-glutamyltranspeptidase/glutathione hydrolase